MPRKRENLFIFLNSVTTQPEVENFKKKVKKIQKIIKHHSDTISIQTGLR